ncbi:cytochrome P450 2J5-like [Rhineura floridana]|uniref:cytochrome P450 2J5-like n=1 Tax=Rhineura floridana TaxID=261503 RepID=UPI002AC7E790|nr:cytochrome P450 2J5-like [Rhineura floridana]
MGISGVLVAALISFLTVQFVTLLWKHRPLPPGPLPLPIIGSLWRVGWKIRQDTLMKLASSYGNVFTLWIGHTPVVVLAGFEAVYDGLTGNPDALSGKPMFPSIKVLGKEKGILFSNCKTWKEQRHFGQAALKKLGQMQKGLVQQIEKEACQLVEIFAQEKGQPLDPSLPIMLSVSRVISSIAFGHPVPTDDKALRELTEHFSTVTKFRGSVGEMIYNVFPSLMQYLPGSHKKVLSSCEFIRSFIKKEIENRKKDGATHEPQDYLGFYLAQMDKEKIDSTTTFEEENLVQVIFDLFVAGTDTLTATLSWALHFMVAHPDIQEKVKKELGSALSSSKSICYEDRKKLPYTRAVINEIQRFSNIILFGGPRVCVDALIVLGRFIEKNFFSHPLSSHLKIENTLVIPDLCSVNLDPKHWETPHQFNPNHFLDKDGKFMVTVHAWGNS